MDPYIETPELWPDFHADLAAEIRARLNPRLQPDYYARLTPYVTYDVVEIARARPRSQAARPDVGVFGPLPLAPRPSGSSATAEAPAEIDLAPVMSAIQVETLLRLFTVEIHESETGVLVTAIEILSPVNKRSAHEARADYLRKRRELLRSAAHVMEIDLLRAGERSPLDIPVPDAPYYVALSRADSRPSVEVWPIQLADRLPVLPVPLTEPDPDVPLDLGRVVASVYERGAYGAQIDYRLPPPAPALTGLESTWVDALLRERALR